MRPFNSKSVYSYEVTNCDLVIKATSATLIRGNKLLPRCSSKSHHQISIYTYYVVVIITTITPTITATTSNTTATQ